MPNAPIELLSILDRPLRIALPDAVASVHTDLDAIDGLRDPATRAEQLSRCLNMTALIEVQFGRPQLAQALCSRHIGWIAALVRRTGARELQLYALQPWVNLARLDRLSGRVAQAEQRLAILLTLLDAHVAQFDDIRIEPRDWPALVGRMPELREFLVSVWISETLLAALRSRRHQLIEQVERRIDSSTHPAVLAMALVEAQMLAQVLAWGPPAPHVDNLRLPAASSELAVHALALRRFQLKSLAPDHSQAADHSVDQLLGLAKYHLGHPLEAWRLAIVQHCVAWLRHHAPEHVAPLARAAADAAARVGDEVLRGWFIDTVVESGESTPAWQRLHEQLREQSWRAALRGEAAPDQSSRERRVSALTERVVEQLALA